MDRHNARTACTSVGLGVASLPPSPDLPAGAGGGKFVICGRTPNPPAAEPSKMVSSGRNLVESSWLSSAGARIMLTRAC